MITVCITRFINGQICGFTARNHSASEVCAAVSLLTLNTVNSIEALTDDRFLCQYDEDGGFIQFDLQHTPSRETAVLLDSLLLGLRSVKARYPNDIRLREVKKLKPIPKEVNEP